MKSKLTLLVAILAQALFGSGCASVMMLPKTAAEAPFDSDKEGRVGWSSYIEKANFNSVTEDQIFVAAKVGLAYVNFQLRRAQRENGVVIGEHGVTWHDWNVIAGIYFRIRDDGYEVLVQAEGSKDIDIVGDQTGGAWTGQILQGMRNYLSKEPPLPTTKKP